MLASGAGHQCASDGYRGFTPIQAASPQRPRRLALSPSFCGSRQAHRLQKDLRTHGRMTYGYVYVASHSHGRRASNRPSRPSGKPKPTRDRQLIAIFCALHQPGHQEGAWAAASLRNGSRRNRLLAAYRTTIPNSPPRRRIAFQLDSKEPKGDFPCLPGRRKPLCLPRQDEAGTFANSQEGFAGSLYGTLCSLQAA